MEERSYFVFYGRFACGGVFVNNVTCRIFMIIESYCYFVEQEGFKGSKSIWVNYLYDVLLKIFFSRFYDIDLCSFIFVVFLNQTWCVFYT